MPKFNPKTAETILIIRNLHEQLYFEYLSMNRDPQKIKQLVERIRETSGQVLPKIEEDL